MTVFKGTVTAISQKQGGISKTGKEWSKSIVFSVMNDNIEKMGFVVGGEYEVEVDFIAREYNGKTYLSASCWKAMAMQQPAIRTTEQHNEQSFYSDAKQKSQTTTGNNADDLPF